MASEVTIHILLATLDGARFLPEQLQSIVAQDDPDWRLLVRDDGSGDATPQLLADAARQDRRVRVLEANTGAPDPAANFFTLMQEAVREGARYFALCDQDDIWLPQKLSLLRTTMRKLEGEVGSDRPLLCWSDLQWIDALGRPLAQSHFRRAGAATALAGPGLWLLAMNVVPGCAMLGNGALLERALPRPAGIIHHDWWLALLAAACGHVSIVNKPLVAYRQHAGNVVGAVSPAAKFFQAMRSPGGLLARSSCTYWQAVANAVCLQQRLAEEALCHQKWMAAAEYTIRELGSHSAWRRAWAVLTGPVGRIGGPRSLAMLVAALSRPRPVCANFSEHA